MKLRNISTIISREYLTRVKKKSFLLTTFLVPIFFAAVCILPSVIMVMATDIHTTVGDHIMVTVETFQDLILHEIFQETLEILHQPTILDVPRTQLI